MGGSNRSRKQISLDGQKGTLQKQKRLLMPTRNLERNQKETPWRMSCNLLPPPLTSSIINCISKLEIKEIPPLLNY